MTERSIEAWTPTCWRVGVQHPSIRISVVRLDGDARDRLPLGQGCYVLLAISPQVAYVGTSTTVRERALVSWQAKIAYATHAVVVEPVGVRWTDSQRFGLESRLIRSVGATVNRAPGRAISAHDGYLDGIVTEVLQVCRMLLPRAGAGHRQGVPSQAAIARQLVLAEVDHPATITELVHRLRSLGWTARGRTVHRTLRRDLRDRSRGGSSAFAVDGAWSDPGAHVYIVGRRYGSGWRPGTVPGRCA